jgi:protein kinase C substrate 80K-H
MYVNDGVCDYDLCCDGSEEFAGVGGVKCENRCGPIGKEWRRVEEQRKLAKEKAAKRRRTLAKESRELRRQVVAKMSTLSEEIKGLETKRDELKKKLEEAESQDRGRVAHVPGGGGKLGVLLGLAKTRVQELRETLDQVLDQRDDLQDKVEELETILKKFREEYNPNFNDEGVKAAVKAWDDYAAKTANEPKSGPEDKDIEEVLKPDSEDSGINWKDFEEDGVSDADIRKFAS